MDISFGSANSEENCATMIECRDRMEPYSTNFDQMQYAKELEGSCLFKSPSQTFGMNASFNVSDCYSGLSFVVKKSERKIFNQSSSTRIEKNTMIVVDKKVYVIGESVALRPVTVLSI